MAKGFDCSTPLNAQTAALFASQGFIFVGRYLAPSGYWKRLTWAEAEIITNAGMYIVSFFETSGGRAKGGSANGAEDGVQALQAAKEVGQPAGTKIYFTVDFEADPNEYETIAEYFIAAKEQATGYVVDGYGNDKILEYLKGRGIIPDGFQTYAWSGGRWMKNAAAHQYQNDKMLNGIGIDFDESFGNEGWWSLNMLKVETANKLIDLLKAIYAMMPDKMSQDEIHNMAEDLRAASGQASQN